MKSSITKVITDWGTSQGPYSFEIRLHSLHNPSLKDGDPFVEMVFIIEVRGFFLDEEHTKPIKLHRERVISIDRFNPNPEYANDLRRDINLFTTETYAEFEKFLNSSETPIYTSDPKFMK